MVGPSLLCYDVIAKAVDQLSDLGKVIFLPLGFKLLSCKVGSRGGNGVLN